MNRLAALLGAQRPVLLDGGMGTLLQDAGLEDGAPGELWNLENRDAVLLLDSLRLKPREEYWDKFWLEYNTSSTPDKCPARVGYFRNLIMLKDAGDPTPLLQRPVGSAKPPQPGAGN